MFTFNFKMAVAICFCMVIQPMPPPHIMYSPTNFLNMPVVFADDSNNEVRLLKTSGQRVMPAENPKVNQKQMVFMIDSKNSVYDLIKRNIYASDPVARQRNQLRAESIILERPMVKPVQRATE